MKHLIAFLGHTQSRISHPVYRQFVQAPIARRNASLLFLPRPLEERELVHEINQLRKRDNLPDELTFHICATLGDASMGSQIIQTVMMIRRIYDCPSFAYCLLPDLNRCSDEQRKATWDSLAAINNGVNEYPHLQLLSHCFLYHDASQVSLARFLFNITQHTETLDLLNRCGFLGKLYRPRKTGDVSYVPEFPAIFSTFNAQDISYPEDEVRYYIHQSYLQALLALSRPATNAISMEQCNAHVTQLLASLPLSEAELSLTSSSFLQLPHARPQQWPDIEGYWNTCVDQCLRDLEDRPREEWLNLLLNGLEIHYQTRFREMGVDYFYKREMTRTPDYCQLLTAMISQGIQQTVDDNPYPPETALDIVRSLVNHLQQQAMAFTLQARELNERIDAAKQSLSADQAQWDAMGFFNRMRGKDKALLDQFRALVTQYYILRTRRHGASFAVKLLNELIPQVSALHADDARHGQLCQEAYDLITRYLADNPPSAFIPAIFDAQPVSDSAEAIRVDWVSLHRDYRVLIHLLYHEATQAVDAESLLQLLRDTLSDAIDSYILQRIDDGTMPPVLGVRVTERLREAYADRGGLPAMIADLKKESALTLQLKGKGGHNEQYLLIAPQCDEIGPYTLTSEISSVHMLHLISGISLTALDGFSGQRMFVEPSIF